MGRWAQYDEDDYRLPEGMKRVCYDADSGRYYFRDSAGLVYEGPVGSRFGVLTLVSEIPTSIPKVDLHAPILALDENGTPYNFRGLGTSYRALVSFFLIPASSIADTVRSTKQRLGWDRALARIRRWRVLPLGKTRHSD
ncbi:hypothetical protein CY34DRAFT_811803 [Suillus luteus UH-Slu-Lm8-n1]|uniref:Uncharacterized protein n=1 Tax=Suillus luteus UH-Slu-Lm8-n1 TaxID=930992 RepID=A0A0C9ZEL6_9AGAM|nr:hypothetical protein CY34DRAFT_811803 [Suillus luteus UH-Slu-Lm8-n1]